MRRFVLPALFVTIALGQGCDDVAPDPLRATPPGTGATVVFDLLHRPLPDVPIPNDMATFPDPTSRTGRRINASLVAPSHFEQVARQVFSEMEGWGTYAPIWLRFEKPPTAAPLDAALDLENVRARMQGDDFAFADDPVYVIDLSTGVPAVLDVGSGSFPMVLKEPQKYWPNDPHVASDTLLFDPRDEAPGLTTYDPAYDTDFDGVIDHPNTLGPGGDHPGVDNLLTWYERETDSLIIRPLLPLKEKTEYAVVMTDRLRGSDGKPVRSPFPGVYHPQQRVSIARLRDALSKKDDPKWAAYYGDIAGTGLDHVAFAWTFTTQPVHEDMQLLRDGLYGQGPFARFKDEFPPKVTVMKAAGNVSGDIDGSPECQARAKTPYVIKPNDPDVRESFKIMYKEVFDYDPGDIKALDESNTSVDHVVVGYYDTPFLQGAPDALDPDARFHVDFKTGKGDVRHDKASFWLVVPKATARSKQPFPVALFGHGVGGNGTESLAHGGNYARNGVATVTINMPMHGFPAAVDYVTIANGELGRKCLKPWVDALFLGRTHDFNGDGETDPGWWWWTAHVGNVRDNVRQGTLDEMQFTRILRTFDGKTLGDDYNGDGKPELAGDFDADGVVDVGGPELPIYSAGESLGGIMSEIHGGIDHQITATAPMSGGGGLSDIALRSYGVVETLAQLMSPLVVSIPATDRPPNKNGPRTNCSMTQRSVRMLVDDGDSVPEVEIACLDPGEDSANMTVVLTNLANGEQRCARTLADGRFRVPIPASVGDRLDVQFYGMPDAVTDYKTCRVKTGAPAGRRITTFEQKAPTYGKVAADAPVGVDLARQGARECSSPNGCAQFMDQFFPVGDALIAVQEGLGDGRNTPEYRRLAGLVQAIVDPADPINYARYYMLEPLLDPSGKPTPPRGLLNINTVGDGFVSISTGVAFARAAGAVPFFAPQALSLYPEYQEYVTPQALYDLYGHRTPNQVLIDTHLVEGIARLGRHPAGPACGVNYNKADPVTCPGNPVPDPNTCKNTLFDVDWLSEGRQMYDAQHLAAPLRLARRADGLVSKGTALAKAWEPRLLGTPLSTDDAQAWKADARTVGLVNVYIQPGGKHTWETGDACKLWDDATYGGNMAGHYFATGGKDPYYLSHPASHQCLERKDCDFYK